MLKLQESNQLRISNLSVEYPYFFIFIFILFYFIYLFIYLFFALWFKETNIRKLGVRVPYLKHPLLGEKKNTWA